MVQRGLLIIVSGPSGAGKGTVCKRLAELMPDLWISVSCTTRSAREGEIPGVTYFFKTHAEFEQMMKRGDLLEWAQVYSNYYGTPRGPIEERLEQGYNVVLEIEMQGAAQVKQQFPQGVFIFLIPPSLDELKRRLIGRGSETQATFNERFGSVEQELARMSEYDYVVVNDTVEAAVERMMAIITAEACSVPRHLDYYHNLMKGAY
ncbi:MAG: guanylate kinase [Bacilli bacterium]|nr:guanylate kinase [Bacilli bacterium]